MTPLVISDVFVELSNLSLLDEQHFQIAVGGSPAAGSKNLMCSCVVEPHVQTTNSFRFLGKEHGDVGVT